MTLTPGTRLGSYEILSVLGDGGMGEVYRARDTRLDRTVAIKTLREHLATDAARRARFDREARILSQLRHPHICALFDVGRERGIDFLVMEYLEGQTLADRLHNGPLSIDQALQYAIQMAGALDAAHRQGIIHRDLKPANVMLTKSGATLLDFGIARVTTADILASAEATGGLRSTLTGEGRLVLGTLQYMAPEQMDGRGADTRSDLFAFGAVLYEMLTGRRAFAGETQSAIVAAVLEGQPPALTSLQPLTSSGLDHLVRGCLTKDPEERWQNAGDLKRHLQWLATDKGSVGQVALPASTTRRVSSVFWASALTLVVFVAIGAVIVRSKPAPIDTPEMRVDVVTPPNADSTAFAVSPDGRMLVFRSSYGADLALWLRPLEAESAHVLPGTDGGNLPFWSPDSRTVGFFAHGKLKRLDLASGSVQTVTDAPFQGSGGTWNAEGIIVFGGGDGTLQRVNASGGAATAVTTASQGVRHRFPAFLPDGHRLLFYGYGTSELEGVYAASLDSTRTERLFPSNSRPVLVSPDRVLFAREGALFSQRLHLSPLSVVGEPRPFAAGVVTIPSFTFGSVALSASATGVIAYRAHDGERQFVWFDRTGARLAPVGAPDLAQPRLASLSPDGRVLAFTRTTAGNADLWLLDVERPALRRFTSDPGVETQPIWSPDSRRIAYISSRTGKYDLYEQPADGSAQATLLLATSTSINAFGWSPDGRYILYSIVTTAGRDLWALPLDGERKPFPVVESPFEENLAKFSPDGHWIAFESNESGRQEIYLQAFPHPVGKIQLSTGGGVGPIAWRNDGRELFFLGPGNQVTCVSLSAAGSLIRAGAPQVLFPAPLDSEPELVAAPDGRRFLFKTTTQEATPITLVLNWRKPTT